MVNSAAPMSGESLVGATRETFHEVRVGRYVVVLRIHFSPGHIVYEASQSQPTGKTGDPLVRVSLM